MWFGVFRCGFVWFVYYLVVINVFLCDLGVICFWIICCDIIEVRLGLIWFVFGVVWCLMVWFGVIFTLFCVNRCFIVKCDLVLNYLVSCYVCQVRSEMVCFWCALVSFGVVWWDFYICFGNRCFIVWFGCDLFLDDLIWYYWRQLRSELVCFRCGLMCFGVVSSDFSIFGGYGCLIVWFGCDLVLNYLLWYYWGQIISNLVCFSYCLVSYSVVWCDFYNILC